MPWRAQAFCTHIQHASRAKPQVLPPFGSSVQKESKDIISMDHQPPLDHNRGCICCVWVFGSWAPAPFSSSPLQSVDSVPWSRIAAGLAAGNGGGSEREKRVEGCETPFFVTGFRSFFYFSREKPDLGAWSRVSPSQCKPGSLSKRTKMTLTRPFQCRCPVDVETYFVQCCSDSIVRVVAALDRGSMRSYHRHPL